ncbi:er lumen protein-retaining receptor [Anaeramoeba flamelloides]|uniref:Er lumen protein-retaining receptor n=1 Tax=Anaeramoeba flamelloides TaxID=1746091 RepID=A0AAV7YH09_9EUKA|nr:er lumen protein-retaining receptor [Anaeramoeba flamelloides]KAJ6251114.1 er lumen protein-retaining receptor [Anaeramoeba flamelloides]
MYNIFRVSGDFLHLISIFIILTKIIRQRSCYGISLRTQELYAIVFITRYLDLFTTWTGLYNTLFKIFYLASSIYIVYLMRKPYKLTYDHRRDVFRSIFLIIPSVVLALIFTANYRPMEILWTFSIILESVAIFPQIILLQQSGEIENVTANYVVCLGGYRALYILNWIYRLFAEKHYRAWLVWVFGLIQTGIYSDFAYYFVKAYLEGKKLSLPK